MIDPCADGCCRWLVLGAGALCAGVGGPGSCWSRSAPSGSAWLLAPPLLAWWGCLGLVVPVPFLQVPRLLWPCAFSDGSSVNGMPYFTFTRCRSKGCTCPDLASFRLPARPKPRRTKKKGACVMYLARLIAVPRLVLGFPEYNFNLQHNLQ